MPDPVITLTTDFGDNSPYVAAMKGVILGINPSARLVDLSHHIPPQDLRHAAFFLAGAVPFFPPGVLHVVVVDPGVGSERAVLYVEVDGHRLLVPDNGCWTWLPRARPSTVLRLTESRYWRPAVSNTFHGRDVLAPAAGHLSRGVAPERLGEPAASWVELSRPEARGGKQGWAGEVLFVDHFGNLITNIPGEAVRRPPDMLTVGRRKLTRGFRWVRTYADAEPGSLVGLVSSGGFVEVAVPHGSAARRLKAGVGTPVTLGWRGGQGGT